MTVYGIETFRSAFAGVSGSYALIGGSACDLIMADIGLDFRATKDLDVVVLTDRPSAEFGHTLWRFVRSGGYSCGHRSDGAMQFYRFFNPTTAGYPRMIELFSRHPDFPLHDESSVVGPLPMDDDLSSLSATLLDDDYYSFLTQGLEHVDGLSIVNAAHLIPLKARAHIDLHRQRDAGHHVNTADLKKHQKDVLRLVTVLPEGLTVDLSDKIRTDMRDFVADVRRKDVRIDQLGFGANLPTLLARLEKVYGL